MIHRQALLTDLQKLLPRLENDLRERHDEMPEIGDALQAEFNKAKEQERTALSYENWLSDYATQIAAAWVLSCVFARFLEDNQLVDPPRLAGPSERLKRARDEHELYFRSAPTETDREYLLHVFGELAKLKGGEEIFGRHNLIHQQPTWLSGDAAGELLKFFQKIDANSGQLVHDFTDPAWDTRFLGDLYQDLSEAARKKYALLQTPEFVEEFILDRTLDPALDEFGLTPRGQGGAVSDQQSAISKDGELNADRFKMIDPACGSGHFLLGAFPRILDRWQRQEPGTGVRELVQRTLDSIHGVDVNPYAIAITRFRLLLAALRACGITRLKDAPAFRMHLACGDSLYHGRESQLQFEGFSDEAHYFATEDADELRRILREGTFHCVVANPPYITPKDRAANQAYRRLYPNSCHMKYSLAVPFMERLFRLSMKIGQSSVTSHQSGDTDNCELTTDNSRAAGFVGQITANSFMKREFGKKLIESFFPTMDLTHVIDTSGAYIPGHGTPTVILFGQNRDPINGTIRTVMGIRGEPSTPEDPSRGRVWSAIVEQINQPGSQSEFVSVDDSDRELFHKHPWSIGGGGAAELKERLEQNAPRTLSKQCDSIGFMAITGEDDVFVVPKRVALEYRLPTRPFVVGDMVRDWEISAGDVAIFPYDSSDNALPSFEPEALPQLIKYLWPHHVMVRTRSMFGKSVEQHGFRWYEYMQFIRERVRASWLIVFGEVATHNHFVLDRCGKVFKQTAPVIKLPREASDDDHLALLGLLNSSTACFWMKQVAHQKQMMGGDGIRIESKAKVPYAFSGTQLGKMPIPKAWDAGPLRERLIALTRTVDRLAARLGELTPERAVNDGIGDATSIRETWQQLQQERRSARSQMVLLQEEIDFTAYVMWELADANLLSEKHDWPEVLLDAGDRPFDILRGRNEDDFPVPGGIPDEWPADLRDLWKRRIDAIQKSPQLKLIEDPHYKRRWIGRQGLFNHARNKGELTAACAIWLVNKLEGYFDFDGRLKDVASDQQPASGKGLNPDSFSDMSPPLADIQIVSTAKLADVAAQDAAFMSVAEIYRDDPAFDVHRLVEELVAGESVPLLPVLRYKLSGLRKRAEWERTWELQREQDKQSAISDQQSAEEPERDADKLTADRSSIPVPPKYTSADFISTGGARYWALRGKLDVPKERWISFPHCEGEDGSLPIAWAGYDHLQQALAIGQYFQHIKDEVGGAGDPRLEPLLAGLLELIPWLKQWHNEPSAEYGGTRMGDYFEGFVQDEARQLGKTVEEIRAWQPPKRASRGRGRRRAAT